jgi:serine/threonine-protein kinase
MAGAGGGGPSQPGSGKLAPGSIFYQDIRNAMVDGESAMVMAALQTSGWGDAGRNKLGIDFSFEINEADASVPRRMFTQDPGALPDCDTGPIPLPPGGKVEGSPSDNYACDGGDCHLLVYQGMRLYELYQANVTGGMATGGTFTGTCLVIWDLTKDYWVAGAMPYSRGDHCNGADAGDMPMAPLLLTPEEIKSGKITHAMRFTISNNRIRKGVYVHPATHIGGPTGGTTTLPYGARLRLRADYPMASLPSDAARTIATALQTYGMFLADGGNIYISATTSASSATSGSALNALQPSDFQMVDGGPRIPGSGNCNRTPIGN